MFRVVNSKGWFYYLHGKIVELRNGNRRRIYYFSKNVDREHALPYLPEGFEVVESRNGLPLLRKIRS